MPSLALPSAHLPARPLSSSRARCLALLAICGATMIALCVRTTPARGGPVSPVWAMARAASAQSYSANEVVVAYAPADPSSHALVRYARIAHASSSSQAQSSPGPREQLLRLARGVSVAQALARLRAAPGVVWAVPDYIAHIAGEAAPVSGLIPNDEGTAHVPGGWEQLQWNFVGEFGVGAPEAWAHLAADGAPGGRGVIVAVLDTGVAYATRGHFRRSPDLDRYTFVKGYDFISKDPYPYDHNGHGTFVASEIAEETNNHYGLTGLAFGTRIMPVRVLDSQGEGEASTIAEGVYFAVRHHARVINLSLEFSPGVTAADIPELISALDYAHRRGVLVVAAAGNEGHEAIAYPARAPNVVSVGATTEHGCLADYSNDGARLTLVAPGGGADADLPGDPHCRPEEAPGRDVYQVTFTGSSLSRFGMPSGYEGTSMATPQVAATAALIIASGVLGRDPTPAQLTARLRATARKLGGGGDESLYGAGLLDAAAATAPGGPGALAR